MSLVGLIEVALELDVCKKLLADEVVVAIAVRRSTDVITLCDFSWREADFVSPARDTVKNQSMSLPS